MFPLLTSTLITWLQYFQKKFYDTTLKVPVYALGGRVIVFNFHFLPSFFDIMQRYQTCCSVVYCFSLSEYSCIVFLHTSHGYSHHTFFLQCGSSNLGIICKAEHNPVHRHIYLYFYTDTKFRKRVRYEIIIHFLS